MSLQNKEKMGMGLFAALNFLSDGLALVSRKSEVLFATESAKQFLACDEGTSVLSRFSPIRRALELASGDSSLPPPFALHIPGKDDMPAYAEVGVFAMPLNGVFLVVLRNQTDVMLYAELFHNLMEMLSSNLRQPVKALTTAVRRAEKSRPGRDEMELLKEAVEWAKTVSEGSENLVELANMMGHLPFAGDERIPAADLFRIVMDRLRQIAAERGLPLRDVGGQAWLPTIYGSMKWLSRAIEEHLVSFLSEAGNVRALIAQATPSESGFVMTFKAGGAPMSGTGTDRRRDPQTGFQTISASHLAIFRHILKLHGFRVRLRPDRDGDLLEISFEYREPRLNRLEPGIDTEQAQNYAKDFVRLYQVLKDESRHETAS